MNSATFSLSKYWLGVMALSLLIAVGCGDPVDESHNEPTDDQICQPDTCGGDGTANQCGNPCPDCPDGFSCNTDDEI